MDKQGIEASISQTKISIIQGDITKQATNAIVNAANSSLMGGGGVDGAIDWVQSNTNLWKTLDPKERAMFKDLAQMVGSIGWLDADWVIEAIKSDFPAVASLFLGWRKAHNWLKRQCETIRNEVEGRAIPNSEPIKLKNPQRESEPSGGRQPHQKSEPRKQRKPNKKSEPQKQRNPKSKSEPKKKRNP